MKQWAIQPAALTSYEHLGGVVSMIKYNTQASGSIKNPNLGWYSIMVWCTSRNKTFEHQQLSLYQLHTGHSFTATSEAIFPLAWSHAYNMPVYKIIATGIDHVTLLRANNTCVMCKYKSVPGYSWLINWCLAPPMTAKLLKPQNSEL